MLKALRIISCVLAATAAAVAVPIFIFFDLWGLIPVGLCIAFAAVMFICKYEQEKAELKKNPPAPEGDFITGRVEKNAPADGGKETH